MGKGGWGKGGWDMNPWAMQQMYWAAMMAKGWGKGWGKGGGWGKGYGGKGKSDKPKSTVPADFVINDRQLFTGTVSVYYKFQGYGFIDLDQKGIVPDDKVFCYWKAVNSSDRFPTLTKDMKVQLCVEKVEKRGAFTLQATNVSMVGGGAISLQDEADVKKTFVGGQNVRYTGLCKFFIPKRGYGYILIDDGYQYGGFTVPREIRVETAEMNAGGAQPGYLKDVQVEFGIWETPKKAFKAYNVTLPGGAPVPEFVQEAP
eukprot:gnl/TRDRNA2_/TRDRNA2_166492_c1_seq1.p1 gnl/TRDRNA2_/TRDRNA2_166492_c1~~gnl/TRDRNA2_/TRDRNA2_166492_c1_seq1.p1  ORF type:complete len:258 (+),score=66.95 gnl/TRDRNA2_/TRDRNA2_166492_c1_seq1:98-871(+)